MSKKDVYVEKAKAYLEEQKGKLDTIQEDLNKRQSGLIDKITAAQKKLQKLHQEQKSI